MCPTVINAAVFNTTVRIAASLYSWKRQLRKPQANLTGKLK